MYFSDSDLIMNESKPKHISINIDKDSMEEGVTELAKLIRPQWNPEKFVFKVCNAQIVCV